jgi:signal transduction histidine kinase
VRPELPGPAGRRLAVAAASGTTLLCGAAAAALVGVYLSSRPYPLQAGDIYQARVNLMVLVLVVAAAWFTCGVRPRLTAGLAVAAWGWALPVLATLVNLPLGLRVAGYAASPGVAAGISLMFLRWRTDRTPTPTSRRMTALVWILTGIAAMTLILGYEPFADPGCTTACSEGSTPLGWLLSTRTAVIVAALLVAVATGFAAVQILRSVIGPLWMAALCALSVAAFMVASIIRPIAWTRPGRELLEGALTTGSLAVLAIAALAAALMVIRARRAVDDVVAELTGEATDPAAAEMMLRSVPDTSRLGPAAELALSNARLRSLSAARIAELRASRRRIVAASDAERRRIERDLHDGVQQRLVSASLHLAIASDHSDPAAAERVTHASTSVREALAQLRRLSRGVYPQALTDEGLAAALEDLAAGADIPVELDARTPDHLDSEASMAAYALAAEILAAASHVDSVERFRIEATNPEGVIRLVVTTELDHAVWSAVAGDSEDRIGALGGTVDSDAVEPGLLRVTAVIPCAS